MLLFRCEFTSLKPSSFVTGNRHRTWPEKVTILCIILLKKWHRKMIRKCERPHKLALFFLKSDFYVFIRIFGIDWYFWKYIFLKTDWNVFWQYFNGERERAEYRNYKNSCSIYLLSYSELYFELYWSVGQGALIFHKIMNLSNILNKSWEVFATHIFTNELLKMLVVNNPEKCDGQKYPE